MPHILTDRKTKRLSYRRPYPADLRPYIPNSPVELKRSLRSTSLNDPQAARLYAEAQTEYERNVAIARHKASGTARTLTDADAPFLAASYVHSLRKNLNDTHWDDDDASREWMAASAWRYAPFAFMDSLTAELVGRAEPWTNAQRLREALPALIAELKTIRADGVRSALIEAEGQTAEDLCLAHGIAVDTQAPAFVALCRLLLDADIDTARQLAGMVDPADSTPLEVPPAPPEPSPHAPEQHLPAPAKAKVAAPLMNLFNGYATAQGLSPRVASEWGNAIRQLIAFLGHDDAARLTRDGITHWRDDLLSSPSRYGRPRKPVTVRDKYIVALRCTLAWAVGEGLLADNAATEVVVRIPRTQTTRHKDFTLAEARTVLRASLVPPSAKLSAPSARARRWIPWLCAYSGARVGKIAQLRTGDVRQEDGVWVMNITPEAGTVKTKEARIVPLHLHLIDQGFVAMVAGLPDGPLFYDPGQRRAMDSDSSRHVQKVGERLAKWVRKDVRITDQGIKPNHAWRHMFKTIAGEVGMEERTADAIQGHTPVNVSRRYGRVSVRTKAEALALFPRFDFGD